uniref:Uncharacterized protein n=1 Tax=Macrostomum lignano TaxID=282301 RepID=A0A1I8JFL1_9PLAT
MNFQAIKMNENANFAQIIQTLQEKVSNSTSSSVLKKDLLDLKEWVAKDPERRPISREDMANPALLADLQRRLETLKRTAKAIDQGMGCALPTPSANTAEQAVKNMPPLKSGHLSLVSLAIAIKVINAEFRSLPSQLIELLRDGDLASRYGQVAKLYICNGFRPSVHVVYTARSDAAAALHQICASLPSELKFRISTEWVISGDMDCSLSCGNWDPAVGCTYITYSKLPTEQCVLVKLLSNTVVDPRSVPWQFLNALNCASKALASGKVVDTANSDRSSQLILLKSSAPLQDPRSIPLSKSVAESNATQATASTAAFVSMNLASASTTTGISFCAKADATFFIDYCYHTETDSSNTSFFVNYCFRVETDTGFFDYCFRVEVDTSFHIETNTSFHIETNTSFHIETNTSFRQHQSKLKPTPGQHQLPY